MTRQTRRSFSILVVTASLSLAICAGIPPESGRPLTLSFGPKDYGADAQTWAVVKDPRGLLYAANNSGVLEFDGARWRLVHTRDNTAVRSLGKDAQGRIFVGACNEFGFLDTDAFGATRYVSLDDRLPATDRDFGNIWTLATTSRGVFFVAESRLFHWDGTQLRTWKAPTRFFMGYEVRDRFLVLDKGQGLMELAGDGLRPIPGGQLFAGQKPRFMVPWESGNGGAQEVLWGSRTEGLVRFDGQAFHKLHTRADRYLQENILYAGIRRADGTLAMATIQGGIVLLDHPRNRMRLLSTEDGIQNQTAYCVFEDTHQNLWVGGSRGIEELGWPRLTRFDEQDGLSGVVMDLRRHQGSIYATTNRGVFRMSPGEATTGRSTFRPVSGIKGQCWDFCALGSKLLVANYDGIYEIAGDQGRRILSSTGHTTAFGGFPSDPNRLFVGTVSGLHMLQRRGVNAPWRDEGPVAGIREEVRSLIPDEDGSLWVGFDAPLAARISFRPGAAPIVERFGPGQGLPEDPWFFTTRLGGQAVVYSPSGFFRYQHDTGRFRRDPRMESLHLEGDGPLFRATEAPGGRLWIGCRAQGTRVRGADPDATGRYHWSTPPVEITDSPVYVLRPEADGTLWFAGVEGAFRAEVAPASGDRGPEVLIRSALKQGGEPVAAGVGSARPRIPFTQNSLRFEYAVPFCDPGVHPSYQILLSGHDVHWSTWTGETYRDYTNLPEGKYQFRVRARVQEGETPSEAVFEFQILRPWYRTPWAYAFYLLVIGGALSLAHRMRVRFLKRRNEELEARVSEATQTLAQQASELAWMNQELRELNDQKNHFLGIVSHDLKSPLNGIIMATETLRTTRDLGLIQQTAQSIESESLAMGALVERFLSVTALESGLISAHLVALEVCLLLSEALARHQPSASAKGIPLSLDLPQDLLWVRADRMFLDEVLDNLISNAIKFSRKGEEVRLAAKPSGSRVRLMVEDQGPGLQPQDFRRLFTRFARLSAKPTHGERSVGLGLSIAHQLVEAMGGEIGAEMTRERGAAFWVELPRAEEPGRG